MIARAGELCALGTALCWSGSSNLFAAAGRRMGSQVLNRLRIVAACAFLMTALTIARGTPWPLWATGPQLVLLALSGFVGFVFGDAWYFRSLVILGPGRAALLTTASPLLTALIAWPVLHERLGPLAVLGMLLTVGGVTWVIGAGTDFAHEHAEGSAALGVVAGLLGAVGQAVGYVLSKSALRTGIDPLSATVIRVAAAAAVMWLVAVARREAAPTLAALADRRAAAFTVGGAFMGPFMGVTLSLAALHWIDAGVAASITAIHPVFTMIVASRAHGEPLRWRTFGGALVAVAGVVVLFLR